jgi:hypothetical protein
MSDAIADMNFSDQASDDLGNEIKTSVTSNAGHLPSSITKPGSRIGTTPDAVADMDTDQQQPERSIIRMEAPVLSEDIDLKSPIHSDNERFETDAPHQTNESQWKEGSHQADVIPTESIETTYEQVNKAVSERIERFMSDNSQTMETNLDASTHPDQRVLPLNSPKISPAKADSTQIPNNEVHIGRINVILRSSTKKPSSQTLSPTTSPLGLRGL